MPTIKKNFNAFQEDTNISLTDKLVGFASTTYGGERKWSFQSLINNINTKGNSAVKAWVQYDINKSVWIPRSSFNVASVTKGTHPTNSWNYYVSNINFITPMKTKDYCVVASYNFYNPSHDVYNNYWSELWPINAMPYTASQCKLYHYSSQSYSDDYPYIISVVVIGNM